MADSPTASGHVMIAVTDGAGKLVLKHWEVDQFGELHRRGDTGMQGNGTGEASLITLRWGAGRLISAVRTKSGNLKVIVWMLQEDGSLKRLGSGEAGAVSAISLAGCRTGESLLRSAIASNLELIAWKVSSDGLTVTRGPDSGSAAGGVDRISAIFHDLSGPTPDFPLDEGEPILVTAVRTKRKLLKLIKWHLGSSSIDRLDDFSENTGTIDGIARIVKQSGGVALLTFRDGNGRLRLASYKVDDNIQPSVLPDRLELFGKWMFENTLSVVTPAIPTVKGKIVLNLGQPRPSAGFVQRNLLDAQNDFSSTEPQTFAAYPLDSSMQSGATDNQIIRLHDGSLLAIKNGYVWSGLRTPPEWFNTVTINVNGIVNPQMRSVIFVFKSANAGLDWELLSVIDSALIANGDYSWPQPKKNPPLGPTSQTGIWHVGGFDRTELYQDPWTKAIYVSGNAAGGPFEKDDGTTVNNSDALIFKSTNGESWSILHTFEEGVRAPHVMSSTPNFPLVVLTRTGGGTDAQVYALKKGSSALNGPHAVGAKLDGSIVDVATDSANTGDVQPNTPGSTAIARIGVSDRVRIAYPSVNSEKRQVYSICNVTLGMDGTVAADHVATIEAKDPAETSCVLGAFGIDDRSNAPNDAMMFSWIEVPADAASKQLLARYKMFFGTAGQYKAGVLSLAGGAPAPFPRGQIGDYRTSVGFHVQGKTHYLAPWADSTGIYGNIVSLAP